MVTRVGMALFKGEGSNVVTRVGMALFKGEGRGGEQCGN